MAYPMSFDHEKVTINVAKMKKGGLTFEVVVDPDKAILFKEGKSIDIQDVLVAKKIFSDPRKGLVASEHDLKTWFGTSDALEVAKIIISKGEVQLTSEHREKVREEKKKRIISLICRNAVDPKTHLPHPPQRIENALAEAKFRIDEYKSAEDQVQEAVKYIRPILPIRFETKEMEVRIPAEHAAKCYSAVKSFGSMKKDEWQQDGSWVAVVDIPGGMQNDFVDKLNSMTHGNVEIKVLKEE